MFPKGHTSPAASSFFKMSAISFKVQKERNHDTNWIKTFPDTVEFSRESTTSNELTIRFFGWHAHGYLQTLAVL